MAKRKKAGGVKRAKSRPAKPVARPQRSAAAKPARSAKRAAAARPARKSRLFATGLQPNPANFAPLTPVSFLPRTAAIRVIPGGGSW